MLTLFITMLTQVALSSNPAHAFYSTVESGQIVPPDKSQFMGELQFVTNGDEGVNFSGRLDRGLTEDSNLRFELGGGTADFFLGGYYKFVPYPDFGDQPAVGFTTGVQLSRFEDSELSRDVENDLALRFIPFAAKKYELDGADTEPFIALPLALRNFGDETEFASQFVIGSRLSIHDFDAFDMSFEFGFNIDNAPSYISLVAIFEEFDSWFLAE